jgi:hypothetical protein
MLLGLAVDDVLNLHTQPLRCLRLPRPPGGIFGGLSVPADVTPVAFGEERRWYRAAMAVCARMAGWLGLVLIAGTPLPAHAAENPWAGLLRVDVQAMHRELLANHPGAVDTLNRDFSRWLEGGYRQALDRIKTCTSYEGYRFALEAYAAGFRDGHLDLVTDLRRDVVRWPGFLLGWQPETSKFVVRVVGEGKAGEGAPPLGSEVISCDGTPAREAVEREVFPFWGNPAFEFGWSTAAGQWLVDEANPWRTHLPKICKIADKGGTRDYTLAWREISLQDLRVYRAATRSRPKVAFGTRSFGPRGLWVSMPSFRNDREATAPAMKSLIAQATSWRDRDPIVFDVRTSDGGSSLWGQRMLEALYGADLFASRYEPLVAKEYVEWRVSPGNVEHMKGAIVDGVVKVDGAGSPQAAEARADAAAMARALTDGKPLWRQASLKEGAPVVAGKTLPNPVTGRVFLLTDSGCGSACLDFADMVRAMPGTKHVGRTTAADSVYLEVRVVTLPSDIAHLVLPTKVYRNRPRANNQPYVPQHLWTGDIADTAALERWILSLPRAQ